MSISKILTYVVLAIGAIGIILWFVMNNSISGLMESSGASEARELPFDEAAAAVTPLYTLTLVIFAIAIIATLIAVFAGLAKNPSGLKSVGIGIVAFLVILGISYGVAEGTQVEMKDGDILTANESKWVGAGLYMFYILAIIAVGAMITAGIKKIVS